MISLFLLYATMLSDICLDFFELHTLYITVASTFYYHTTAFYLTVPQYVIFHFFFHRE